ncbi:hypothetical protein BayCH28_26025 [Mycolicibacterium sp. CH28]|nr:hypothetical protein BayCH28_26025 [Mycolicibacterium sp. CH28]
MPELSTQCRVRKRNVDVNAGRRANGEVPIPQCFPQYPPPYFTTFLLDPFGVVLKASGHHDRE